MVVDGEADGLLAAADLHGDVVGHVVDDIDLQAPDGFLDLGFHLTVEESGAFDWNVEIRADVLVRTFSGRDLLVAQVVDEGDLSEDLLLAHSISVGQILGKLVVTLYVKPSKVLHNLSRQVFGTGSRDDTQLVRFDNAHAAPPFGQRAVSPRQASLP